MNFFDIFPGPEAGPKTEMLANIQAQHKTPRARYSALLGVYDEAMRQAYRKDNAAGHSVMGANTYTGTIITAFLVDGSITDLVNSWAWLDAYSLAKDVDPFKPLATGQLKHVTSGEAAQVGNTAPASFEPATGSVVAPIQITTQWFNQPCRVGANDLNSGLRLDDLRTKALATFSDAVTAAATAPITAANFTATPLVRAAAGFNLSDTADLQGRLQKAAKKNLILDGTYLARIANQPGFFQKTGEGLNDSGAYKPYGWDGIYLASNWSSAGMNIKGLACHPQAMVRATGLPLNPAGAGASTLSSTMIELPGLKCAVQMNQWLSLATRTFFVSWDLIAGFAAADTSAGIVIANGTPT